MLQDLVELVGYGSAIELLRAWGGRRLKVPNEVHQDHALAFAIGMDAATKIAAAYGGTDLDLPAERNHLTQLRNDALAREFDEGATISWLSQHFGLSRRHVTSVLDRMGRDTERMARARAAGTRT